MGIAIAENSILRFDDEKLVKLGWFSAANLRINVESEYSGIYTRLEENNM